MLNKDVLKINIDILKGNYSISEETQEEVKFINREIKKDDTQRTDKEIKNEILQKYAIPKRIAKKVDFDLYEALGDFDLYYSTDYRERYMSIFENIIDKRPGEPYDFYEERCRAIRIEAMEELGIDITYNVGFINASENLTFLDRIRLWVKARQQARFLGVGYSFKFDCAKEDDEYLLEDFEEDDEEEILEENDLEEKIISETKETIEQENEPKSKTGSARDSKHDDERDSGNDDLKNYINSEVGKSKECADSYIPREKIRRGGTISKINSIVESMKYRETYTRRRDMESINNLTKLKLESVLKPNGKNKKEAGNVFTNDSLNRTLENKKSQIYNDIEER